MVSLLLLLSFFVSAISGAIMEFTHREIDNHLYMGAHRIHNIAAILFITVTAYHLIFNWRALMNYFNSSH